MKDCPYLSVTNFNVDDTFSHKNNKDLICLLIHKFYENNSGASYSLIYNCNTKRTEPNTNLADENYITHNEIISSFINKILKFEEDYKKGLEENPLEASQLLVSVRWGQYAQLERNGLGYYDKERKIRVVNANYSYEFGLDLRGKKG